MSMSERSGSLVSREHEDLVRVSEVAVKNTKDAIKISFRDINYEVRVRNNPQERRETG